MKVERFFLQVLIDFFFLSWQCVCRCSLLPFPFSSKQLSAGVFIHLSAKLKSLFYVRVTCLCTCATILIGMSKQQSIRCLMKMKIFCDYFSLKISMIQNSLASRPKIQLCWDGQCFFLIIQLFQKKMTAKTNFANKQYLPCIEQTIVVRFLLISWQKYIKVGNPGFGSLIHTKIRY